MSAAKKIPTKSESSTKKYLIKKIQKRDGRIVAFELDKLINAILKGMTATGEGVIDDAEIVANKVYGELVRISRKFPNFVPTVEGVQDIVEKELMICDYVKTAKEYILYRQKRAEMRQVRVVPEHVKKMTEESRTHFRNSLGEFVYYRTYSRWIESEQRRETWVETVDRYVDFMKENLGGKLKAAEYKEMREGILDQKAMPSMRLLQFAGPAARKTNVCAYNCSYIAPQSFRDFAEVMYISMCGTGVGYSVESANVQRLPQIEWQDGETVDTFVVPDSKEGWCDALVHGMETWAKGKDVKFDFSLIRPLGSRLATMGGKASGPAPLMQLLDFTRSKMLSRQGARLSNIDCHDILCMIGQIVVSGGVRRSAMISLSDLRDADLRDAKKGQFWMTEPQRSMSNNSAVYHSKPTPEDFLDEWLALMKSGTGERGIFNRGSLTTTLPERRVEYFKKHKLVDKNGRIPGFIGTNPCGEIVLQHKQFCNLTEVVARHEDTVQTLMEKVKIATIIGTYQASLTNFPYLSKEWKEHCEGERLLGVSITGQWDCPVVRKPEVLRKLKVEAIRVNKIYAKRFGIGESTCITTVKPSGNLSQTVDCSSGLHPRFAPYYIRRVRIASTDALFKMLKDQGIPFNPEVGQSAESATTFVLDFPVKAPEGSTFRNDLSAIDQLEYWMNLKKNWTEHNPSATIYIGKDEWINVAHWLYQNWDFIGGLSFLPRSEHVYQLAPYQEITKAEYEELLKKFENIDYSKIVTYEGTDETELKKELACAGGVCEIV